MFCSQCQETAQGTGCSLRGVCGKTSDVANLQDLLIYSLKGISKINQCLRSKGKNLEKADIFVMNGLFMTITNANFDKQRFLNEIFKSLELREELKKIAVSDHTPCHFLSHDALVWNAKTESELDAKAVEVGILSTQDEDIRSLRQLLVLGVKG
ncbi:MAG: hydroxylamine reductase, partial [Bacteroidales bacterium]